MRVVRVNPVCRRAHSEVVLACIHHWCRQKRREALFVEKIGLKCMDVSSRVSKTVMYTSTSYLQLHLGNGSHF